MELDLTTLAEVASQIGIFPQDKDPESKMMRIRVVDWAGKQPSAYWATFNAPDRTLRALIRKALKDEVFTQKGSVIYWDNTMIGADEDGAVATLTNDKVILNALKEKVKIINEPKKKKGS
jgi:hypothetical protein